MNNHIPTQTLDASGKNTEANVLHVTGEPQTGIVNLDFEKPALCAMMTLEQAENAGNALLEIVKTLREMR